MREFSLIGYSRIAILLGNSRCFLGLWGIFKKILPRNSRLGILEFSPKNSRIPKPCVIPRLDRGISSQRILEFHIEILG